MVSDLQSLIVDTMSGNYVPSISASKKMKSAIRSTEVIKSAKIDYFETFATGAAASAKLMEHITAMSLKRARGKTGKSVRKLCPNRTPHLFG